MTPDDAVISNGDKPPMVDGVGSGVDTKKTHKKRKRDQDRTSSKKKRRTENATRHSSQALATSSNSLLYLETCSLWLPVSPISQSQALEGTCAEYLSPLLLTYYQPFRGIVLSYENAKLSEDLNDSASGSTVVLAKSSDEYAGSFVWLTADFVIFRPRKGSPINGWVNIQAQSHLSLICWNLFNASIPRKHLPQDWKWIADGQSSKTEDVHSQKRVHSTGHFINGTGKEVKGWLDFKIQSFEAARAPGRERGFVSIRGTLLGDQRLHLESGPRV